MKINNYNGKFKLSSIFAKNTAQDKITIKISQLCKQFKSEDNLIDIVKIFNRDKALKKQDSSSYNMENYKLLIGTKENIQDYKKTLTLLNKHNISCAPRLEQSAYNKNQQYVMLVLKLPENEEAMKSYISNSDKIDTLAKCKFVNDLETIAKNNKCYNSLITEDLDSIKVTSDGQLYVPDWNFMDKFNNEKEQAQYFNKIRKMFNLVLI